MSEQHEYDGITYRKEKSSPGIFRILFAVLVVWAVIFMGYYLFSGWSSQSEADAVKKERDSRKLAAHKTAEVTLAGAAGSGHTVEAYVAAGKKLYGNLCVACHGENAKGVVGPDLTVSTYKYGKSRLDITKTITEGRPGGMPSFSSQIDKEQIEGLVEFVLSLK
ncbi:MAG: c-type cytochrome [Desulfuromonadaceae bacterium]|nr:c-type cytochrome [Desulfuromonadaceae bacterium]MDD2846994.1 c-type cytochrome [Desulfuromonadaceae bacterium]MDD4129028.1 c-type cytochrome [Desulfuromonadaceae bacterium]